MFPSLPEAASHTNHGIHAIQVSVGGRGLPPDIHHDYVKCHLLNLFLIS